MSYATDLLTNEQQRAAFFCGKEMLDSYIHKQARQDVKAKVAACFVLSEGGGRIKGYYSLSNGSIPRSQLPDNILKKLPRYQDLPITLLGRLAVDKKFHGQKIGVLLLIDALKRCVDAAGSIGSMAVIVDPIDDDAKSFYSKFGFISLPDSGRMFLPMTTIEKLF